MKEKLKKLLIESIKSAELASYISDNFKITYFYTSGLHYDYELNKKTNQFYFVKRKPSVHSSKITTYHGGIQTQYEKNYMALEGTLTVMLGNLGGVLTVKVEKKTKTTNQKYSLLDKIYFKLFGLIKFKQIEISSDMHYVITYNSLSEILTLEEGNLLMNNVHEIIEEKNNLIDSERHQNDLNYLNHLLYVNNKREN